MFWSILQEQLGLLKFQCHFWVSWTIYYQMHMLFFKKVVIILRKSAKHANFWVGVQYSLNLVCMHFWRKYKMTFFWFSILNLIQNLYFYFQCNLFKGCRGVLSLQISRKFHFLGVTHPLDKSGYEPGFKISMNIILPICRSQYLLHDRAVTESN